ncbi:hypothetical protein LSTR_LSTR001491 [Laodelphax striatellus]|uniref:Zinc finger HIT domain-containing protein 3 n=1 Tax=Laodelphax striatellus TaxID=195883 RepID=A0A482XAD4_LAOST|nr:hypothetical protein LSTR_LSTR001491 [Laodelphax striatellus]
MDCGVCDEEKKGPYKCPKCRIPYCSLPCWKSHKNNGCESLPRFDSPAKPKGPEDSRTQPKFVTESTVPMEKMKLLGESKAVKEILKNPHVRSILTAIDQSDNPALSMQNAMLEPIFVEFADACIKLVEDDPHNSDNDSE